MPSHGRSQCCSKPWDAHAQHGCSLRVPRPGRSSFLPEVTVSTSPPGKVARVVGSPVRDGPCASVCYHDVAPLHTQTRLRAGVGLAPSRRLRGKPRRETRFADLLHVLWGPHSLQCFACELFEVFVPSVCTGGSRFFLQMRELSPYWHYYNTRRLHERSHGRIFQN